MSDAQVDPGSPEGRGSAAAVDVVVEPGGGPGRLDRRRILGAAIAIIDADGLRR